MVGCDFGEGGVSVGDVGFVGWSGWFVFDDGVVEGVDFEGLGDGGLWSVVVVLVSVGWYVVYCVVGWVCVGYVLVLWLDDGVGVGDGVCYLFGLGWCVVLVLVVVGWFGCDDVVLFGIVWVGYGDYFVYFVV